MRRQFPLSCTAVLIAVLIAALVPLAAFGQVEVRNTANVAGPANGTHAAPIDLGTPPKQNAAAQKATLPMLTAEPVTAQQNLPTAELSPRAGTQNAVPKAKRPAPLASSRGTLPASATAEDAGSTSSVDRVAFNRVPIRVVLRAGRERILQFQNPVTLSVTEEVQALVQRLDIIDRTVYITASRPFPRSRVLAHDLVTGQVIPLDLQASKEAVASGILEISTKKDVARNTPATDSGRRRMTGDADEPDADASVDMVALTRYASHSLYAPRRLVAATAGIRQIQVTTKPAVGLYRGARLETTPIGAWRSQDLYVTAVKFVNRDKTAVELDLTELRGQWIAATSQHGTLAPAGSENDTTAVYLVSERPFEESR